MSVCEKISDLIEWINTFDGCKYDNKKEIELKSDDNMHWQCSNCTFINEVCLYECELCDTSNIAKQQLRDIDEKEEQMGPKSNHKILRKYLLTKQIINNKFKNAFGNMNTVVSIAKYTICNNTQMDILNELLEKERCNFSGIIFRNEDDMRIELLADIVQKIRNLYSDLWIGIEFNFNYLCNNIKRIEKNKTLQSKQIINNLSSMGFSIKCNEFIFQFINDYKLTNIINAIFIKDSGVRVNNKNIACLRCIQKGEFERKHNKNDMIYFGGVNIGINHSDQDCKQLGEMLSIGYMDCVCVIVNQINIYEIGNKLQMLKKSINGKCKIAIVGMKQQIEWLLKNYAVNNHVDVIIYCC